MPITCRKEISTMADATELEKAFSSLSDALALAEQEMTEEVTLIEQKIEDLKNRILDLNTKQETLVHDKKALEEMSSRYNDSNSQ